MKQIISQLTILTTTNINYTESIKTNYANYQSTFTSQNNDALIDVLTTALILIENYQLLEK